MCKGGAHRDPLQVNVTELFIFLSQHHQVLKQQIKYIAMWISWKNNDDNDDNGSLHLAFGEVDITMQCCDTRHMLMCGSLSFDSPYSVFMNSDCHIKCCATASFVYVLLWRVLRGHKEHMCCGYSWCPDHFSLCSHILYPTITMRSNAKHWMYIHVICHKRRKKTWAALIQAGSIQA